MTDRYSRRFALRMASFAGAATLMPQIAHTAQAPITPLKSRPAAPQPIPVYDALVFLEQEINHGETPLGTRIRVPIIGGHFAGPDIQGHIVSGGVDWQLLRRDGYFELNADYFMETTDGVPIHVTNQGLWHSKTNDWPADYAITTPRFEAPVGRYGWLNQFVFAGTVAPGEIDRPSVRIAIYKLT